MLIVLFKENVIVYVSCIVWKLYKYKMIASFNPYNDNNSNGNNSSLYSRFPEPQSNAQDPPVCGCSCLKASAKGTFQNVEE